MKKGSKIEKECTSCGEKGHHYNECSKVPFLGMIAGVIGIPTESVCGMSKKEIIESVDKNAIWNKK